MGSAPKPLFRSPSGRERYRASYDATLVGLWKVPFSERDVPTAFGATHVIVAGESGARPIVLLHSAQASATMWFPNIEALASARRAYAIDFPLEVGKSELERAIRTRSDLASWFIEVLDMLRLDVVDVVGISRGAWNAVALALQIPERIGRLVLLSPAQTFMPITNIGFLLATLRCSLLPSARALRSLCAIAFHEPRRVPALFLEQYALGLRSFNLANGIYLPPAVFSDDELRTLRTPALLMIGEFDIVNTHKAIDRAEALVPRIQSETVAGAGHILSMDRAEFVNARIAEYLST